MVENHENCYEGVSMEESPEYRRITYKYNSTLAGQKTHFQIQDLFNNEDRNNW